MSRTKHYFHDEIEEMEEQEGDFTREEYDIIEPPATNEPPNNDRTPF